MSASQVLTVSTPAGQQLAPRLPTNPVDPAATNPVDPDRRPYTRRDVRLRVLVVLMVTAMPWCLPVANIAAELAAGSRAVLFVVVPVLAWILASSCELPRGVVDAEVDWIVALLGGAGIFTVIALFAGRIPTLAQLWRVELLGPVVWTAVAASVVFGIRYAIRLWDLWVFLLACASPLPFLLLSALLGGSDFALAAMSCTVATIVVFRAARRHGLLWRLAGAVTSFAVGFAASWLILVGSPFHHDAPLVSVALGAGLVPYLVTRVLPRLAAVNHGREKPAAARFPRLSPISIVATLGLSTVMFVVSPAPSPHSAPPPAADNWVAASGLRESSTFGVATGLLGPNATYTRYTASQHTTSQPWAVDVISAPTRGALDDFGKVHWYDSTEPVDYKPVELTGVGSLAVRSAHSNADTTVDPDARHWYVLTWIWRVSTGFQQINIVVNQHETGQLPDPVGVSFSQAVVDPILWIARQRPKQVSEVKPATVELAEHLARQLAAAAGIPDATEIPATPDQSASKAREVR